jgi:hypothetical protein
MEGLDLTGEPAALHCGTRRDQGNFVWRMLSQATSLGLVCE